MTGDRAELAARPSPRRAEPARSRQVALRHEALESRPAVVTALGHSRLLNAGRPPAVQLKPILVPASSGPVVQRREATGTQLGLTRTSTSDNLFDTTRISTGRLFTKTVSVAANDSRSIVSAYIAEASRVGAIATGFGGYMDQDRGNPIGAMPAGPAWHGAANAYLNGLANNPGLSPAGRDFVSPMPRVQASHWLANAWGQPEGHLADAKFRYIDPFLMKLTFRTVHKPTPNDRRPAPRDWVTTTQFAHSGDGYIIEIDNGEKDIRGRIMTAVDFGNAANADAADRNAYAFSSTHEHANVQFGEQLRQVTGHEQGDKQTKHGAGLDAFTWMAAEGARYAPVAALGAAAKPATVFYSKPNKSGWTNARGVSLTWLMQNWGGPFQRAYNIPAATILHQVTTLGLPALADMNGYGGAITTLSAGKRYNLVADKVEG